MDVPELVDLRRDDLWLVLPHLGAGGAQKVALIAARHFAAQGLKVKLVTPGCRGTGCMRVTPRITRART